MATKVKDFEAKNEDDDRPDAKASVREETRFIAEILEISEVTVFSKVIFENDSLYCRCDEIGIHATLKMSWEQSLVGSSPTSGTNA